VDNGKFLSVYGRTADGWKLIRDTWNSDMGPASFADEEPVEKVFAD